MDRRSFFGIGLVAIATGVVSTVGRCSRTERGSTPAGQGNEEGLWKMVESSGKLNEPVESPHAKNAVAAYRDASYGKEDPNFKPKVGGG
jgi:hypothetical protein